jgi:hypothetical protein
VTQTTPAIDFFISPFVNYMADFFLLILKAYWELHYHYQILNYSWACVILFKSAYLLNVTVTHAKKKKRSVENKTALCSAKYRLYIL